MSARRRRPANPAPYTDETGAREDAVRAIEPLEPPLGRIAKLVENWRAVLGGVAAFAVVVGGLVAGMMHWSSDLVRRPELEAEHRFAAGIGEQLGGVEKRVSKVESDQATAREDLAWIKGAVWELLRPTGKVVPPPP